MDKNYVRKEALEKRNSLNKNIASSNVISEIINSNILNNHNNIGIYYPIGNEIDIMRLQELYPNKNFFLPITRDEIYFVRYRRNDILLEAKFHTKEPIGEIVKRDSITCFLIPCVAISKDNKRIGYGKGYYDRYLASYNGLKVGICYKELSEYDVILDEHDIKLDLVIKG